MIEKIFSYYDETNTAIYYIPKQESSLLVINGISFKVANDVSNAIQRAYKEGKAHGIKEITARMIDYCEQVLNNEY